MMMAVRTLTLCLAVTLCACGGSAQETRPAEPPAAEVEVLRPPFTIYQDELERTLARGLQPLIADVSLRPTHEGSKFVGWRLQFRKPGESPYRESAVRPGDVLAAVNGSPLERPDQMMAAWKALEGADTITFSVLRAGRPLDLTYAVVPRP